MTKKRRRRERWAPPVRKKREKAPEPKGTVFFTDKGERREPSYTFDDPRTDPSQGRQSTAPGEP